MPAAPAAAAAAVHQPKIVQTAFIHKLYSMLEDPSIQHLISWSASAESFVMSPSADFSKVLAQYFKHTNISSFVRQLNMYGFHKGATQSRPLSRPATPPAPFSNGGGEVFGAWSWNSANRDNKNLSVRDSSGPPTRRGSMAHILNPTDTAERDDEDEDPRGDDDRKRKRMQ
ncbi:Transcription factor SFL1 [Colletotrichum sp. SAR11_57]|nr:Transcription factor SFL1 [Colletotrichum sp. SAR11_57]